MTAYMVTRDGVISVPRATELERDDQLVHLQQVSGDGRVRRTIALLQLDDGQPIVTFGEPATPTAAFRGVYVVCFGQLFAFPSAMYRLETDDRMTYAELYGVVDLQGRLESIGGPIEDVERDFLLLGLVRLGPGVLIGNGQVLPQGGAWRAI